MKKLIAPLILCLLASGCIGGGFRCTQTVAIEDPAIEDHASACNVRHRTPGDTNTVAYTSAWLREHWGEPSKISHAAGLATVETWTYSFGHFWSGLWLFAIIQLPPIALPVGKDAVAFTLRDDQVVSAKRSVPKMAGGAFGFSSSMCSLGDKFGPFSLASGGCPEDHPGNPKPPTGSPPGPR